MDCSLRYELGLFSFGRQYRKIDGRPQEVVREDVAASLSRRWFVHRWQDAGLFFGLGISFRTRAGLPEGNPFNGSHMNFAEQLGVRWMGPAHRLGLEVSLRHFSNLGIVRPNVGQNFLNVAVVFLKIEEASARASGRRLRLRLGEPDDQHHEAEHQQQVDRAEGYFYREP